MRLFILLLAIVAATTTRSETINRESFHLYLLVGQSNMAGRGKVEEQDRQGNPRVLTLNKDNEWVEAVEPIHFDKPAAAGVGPGLAFGKAMAGQNTNIVIGLIPCAVGGTRVSEWQKGAPPKQPWGSLYDNAISRAIVAMNDGVLKGILWHQGESDCRKDNIEAYKDQITKLVEDFRTDLDAPDVPFVAGELGVEDRPDRKPFNSNLKMLPSWISKSALVSSEGLKLGEDNIHFDSASQRIFGQRYADAMMRLQAGQ